MQTHIHSDAALPTDKGSSTKTSRILIAGGYGLVGSTIARHIRRIDKDVEIVLAGRTPEKATHLANELGNAKTAYLDVAQPVDLTHMGDIDLIVASLHDHKDALLNKAIDKGIAHIGITKMVDEIAPVTFRTLKTPPKRPIVLLGHWQAGALTISAQKAAEQFSHIESIEATGFYDPLDPIGPMVANELDSFIGRALLRINGKWVWADAKQHARQLPVHEGSSVEAVPMATLDVPSLAAITGAQNVRFDFAVGESIGTREGRKASHDLYIDIEGTLKSGAKGRQRTVASSPGGNAHFTALGVLVAVEHILGLNGTPAAKGGMYVPETLISPDKAIERFKQFGVTITTSVYK